MYLGESLIGIHVVIDDELDDYWWLLMAIAIGCSTKNDEHELLVSGSVIFFAFQDTI